MAIITYDTVPEEVEVLQPYAPYLMWSPIPEGKEPSYKSLAQWHEMFPVWPIESMRVGLQRVVELAEKGKILYDVYSPEEVAEDPTRADVKFWFMPAMKQPSEKPFVLCFAGGAYMSVCSDVEAFATAKRMNELGYNVFVPTYRVDVPDLMPKPIEDVAAILRYILINKETFGITNEEYVVNGFSAGANLTCNWGLESIGYAKYGMPKPKALFPIYPVTSWRTFEPGASEEFQKTMFGSNLCERILQEYDVVDNANENYPPCYLVHAMDDPIVPYQNSVLLKEKLDALGVPVKLELAEFGSHGFGDGRETAAEGWPVRAMAFAEKL